MSFSLGFLRQYLRIFQDRAASTRIFFPDDKVLRGACFCEPASCLTFLHLLAPCQSVLSSGKVIMGSPW